MCRPVSGLCRPVVTGFRIVWTSSGDQVPDHVDQVLTGSESCRRDSGSCQPVVDSRVPDYVGGTLDHVDQWWSGSGSCRPVVIVFRIMSEGRTGSVPDGSCQRDGRVRFRIMSEGRSPVHVDRDPVQFNQW